MESPVRPEVGKESYLSKTNGINGKLREIPEDFIVNEIIENKHRAHWAWAQPSDSLAASNVNKSLQFIIFLKEYTNYLLGYVLNLQNLDLLILYQPVQYNWLIGLPQFLKL